MTREEFISAATELYGDKYDYSEVSEQGVRHGTNVIIKCSKHGIFYTTPYQFLHGIVGGCFECYKEKHWEIKKKDSEK